VRVAGQPPPVTSGCRDGRRRVRFPLDVRQVRELTLRLNRGKARAVENVLQLIGDVCVTDLRVPLPMRVPRGRLIAAGGIERTVSAVAQRVSTLGGVLVLLDADDDCPAKLGPVLLQRAQNLVRQSRVV
jgi:hypothetical protein